MRLSAFSAFAIPCAIGALSACPAKVASVEVTPPKVSLKSDNDQKQLTATPKDADGNVIEGKQVTWTSSDTNIAVVDSNGKVKPAGSGTATITAKIDEITGTAAVDVTLVKGIRLESPAIVIKVGEPREPLKIAFSNEKGEIVDVKDAKVEWKTANPNVATVGPDGKIVGVAPGSTTITAKTDVLSTDVAVTVNPADATVPSPEAPREAPKDGAPPAP